MTRDNICQKTWKHICVLTPGHAGPCVCACGVPKCNDSSQGNSCVLSPGHAGYCVCVWGDRWKDGILMMKAFMLCDHSFARNDGVRWLCCLYVGHDGDHEYRNGKMAIIWPTDGRVYDVVGGATYTYEDRVNAQS